MTTAADRRMYAEFRRDFGTCWACKYHGLPFIEMGMPNKLEVCHIVGGAGRRADRRAIVSLCMIHHKIQEGETIRVDGITMPRITAGNMEWLKHRHDPEHYDPEWLRSLRHKRFEVIELESMEGVR